ncbi:MAG: GNAT family N-acetyltransferase [Bacillota bacterium]
MGNKNSAVFGFVAEPETGVIVGFAAAGPERTGNPDYKGEIYAAYVLKAHQRKGIGRALLVAVTGRLLAMGINSRNILKWLTAERMSIQSHNKLTGGKCAT